MADVKWIKMSIDMFDNRKIKYLRRLPDGNSVVLIWVMLLTMAGRCNAGGMIFLTENIPYTTKSLADELGFDENLVKMAIGALTKLNMVCVDEDVLTIPGWEEYQSADKLDKIREQNRIRQAKHRENRKRIDSNVSVTLPVTHSNATDIDIDIDKDIEYKNIVEQNSTKCKKTTQNIPYKEIIEHLNDVVGSKYKHTTASTKKCIQARFKEGFTKDDFILVIDTMYAEWGKDEKMNAYLRPITLFGSKFESYLNRAQVKEEQKQQTDEIEEEEEELVGDDWWKD